MRKLYIIMLTAVLITGCTDSSPKKARMECFDPLDRVRTVAVLPVLNLAPDKSMNEMDLGNAIADEMTKLNRFHVTYPGDAAKSLSQKGVTFANGAVVMPGAAVKSATVRSEEWGKIINDGPGLEADTDQVAPASTGTLDPNLQYRRLAQMLNVDAVLVTRISMFDPYQARMALDAELILSDSAAFSSQEITMLSASGTAFARRDQQGERAFWWMSDVFDSEQKNTRARILAFSQRYYTREHALGPKIFLRVMSRFYDFVAYEMSRDLAIVTNPKRYAPEYEQAEKQAGLKKDKNNQYSLSYN